MTIEEVEQLKEGDLITAYRSGYHKFVRAEPVVIRREQDITEHFKRFHPTPPNGKSNWEVGDMYDYHIYHVTVMNKDGLPMRGKKEWLCSAHWCQPAVKSVQSLKDKLNSLTRLIEIVESTEGSKQ